MTEEIANSVNHKVTFEIRGMPLDLLKSILYSAFARHDYRFGPLFIYDLDKMP